MSKQDVCKNEHPVWCEKTNCDTCGEFEIDQNETYDAFIDRILTNDLARNVKLADINDNMNADRLKQLPEKEVRRLSKKYQSALSKILFYENIENVKF